MKEILNNYYQWLLTIIYGERNLSPLSKLLIYNTAKILYSYESDIKEYLVDVESYFNNIDYKGLKSMSKYHLSLFAFSNGNNSTSLFIRKWINYMKSKQIGDKFSFPNYYWQIKKEDIEILKTIPINLYSLKNNILKYYSIISILSKFGTSPNSISLEINNIYILESMMLIAYKNNDFILGNMIFRMLLYSNIKFDNIMDSAYNHIILQQNAKGYFGNYLKNYFSKDELPSLLNIGFDCLTTLSEYTDSNFRIGNILKI